MKHRAILFLMFASAILVLAGSADAKPFASKSDISRLQGAPVIIIPPEWAGIWTVTDSTFDCLGALTGVSAYDDTLCAGQNIFEFPTDLEKFTIDINCDGQTTPTLVDMTCSGSSLAFKDCLLTFTFDMDVARTGETYIATTVNSISFTGTGLGCDFLPDQCSETRSRGVRIAPEPTAYCATPAEAATWGQIKSKYR